MLLSARITQEKKEGKERPGERGGGGGEREERGSIFCFHDQHIH